MQFDHLETWWDVIDVPSRGGADLLNSTFNPTTPVDGGKATKIKR